MAAEKRISVLRSQKSVVDDEFDSMKDRFEHEMKRVEDEMDRLRHEFDGNMPRGGTHPSPNNQHQSHHTSSSHKSTNSTLTQANSSALQQPRYDPYFEGMKSPLIKDDTDGKTLRLRFNVKDYAPEEVTVKTIDNRLLVHAKHEEKSQQRTVFREYNQEFMLPVGVNPELITSTLSTDGVLTVEAPLPAKAIDAAYPTAALRR